MSFKYEFPYTDPNFYNDDWLLLKMKEVLEHMESWDEWRETHEAQYQELKQLYDDIISGNFPDSVKEAFADWMRENALDLVGELVKMVFFEIDLNGYFVANIPDPWYDILFNTTDYDIPHISGVDYGHLVLSY